MCSFPLVLAAWGALQLLDSPTGGKGLLTCCDAHVLDEPSDSETVHRWTLSGIVLSSVGIANLCHLAGLQTVVFFRIFSMALRSMKEKRTSAVVM